MRRIATIALVLFAAIGAVCLYLRTRPEPIDPAAQDLYKRVPVPTNAGPDVLRGFAGDIHPALHRHAELEVAAHWDPADVGKLFPRFPDDLDEVRDLYNGVKAAEVTRTYNERDFSAFLPPDGVRAPGQMWSLDLERVVVFLKQFHPGVSAFSASVGRRPGPDGAFALLQGVSASHLDIAFRVHAEFDLAPKRKDFRARFAWYSPASFLGRIVVNREAGTVEYFRYGVPTDLARNIHGTVWTAPSAEHPKGYRIYQFLRANRMELVGGSQQTIDGIRWTDRIETAQVHAKLAKVFYKFLEIDFMPFTQALAAARAQKKPIFAFIAVGSVDDQSC
jgi:hypothetical protein